MLTRPTGLSAKINPSINSLLKHQIGIGIMQWCGIGIKNMSENQLTAFDHPINYFHLLVYGFSPFSPETFFV